MDQFHIDGIRFDAADCVDFDFFRRIHNFCKERNPEFWLMGEIIHGDYKRWANPEMLDSVTNYECYKGIYSSHNDKNYFEINYSINRQFGNGGIYQGVALYNFVDNHDVNRLASTLCDQRYLPLCYTLMYCMPGIPSVYYGSEYGVMGRHENNSDDGLRPCLDLDDLNRSGNLDLYRHLVKLGRIYHAYPALRTGSYYTVEVRNRQLLFAKEQDGRTVYVALNLEDCPSEFRFGTHVPSLVDVISGQPVQVENGGAWIRMAPFSSMILVEDDIVNQTEPEAAAVAVPEPTVLEAGAKYRDVLDGSVCELLQTSVRHAETQEELVVYRKEQDGSVCAVLLFPRKEIATPWNTTPYRASFSIWTARCWIPSACGGRWTRRSWTTTAKKCRTTCPKRYSECPLKNSPAILWRSSTCRSRRNSLHSRWQIPLHRSIGNCCR